MSIFYDDNSFRDVHFLWEMTETNPGLRAYILVLTEDFAFILRVKHRKYPARNTLKG